VLYSISGMRLRRQGCRAGARSAIAGGWGLSIRAPSEARRAEVIARRNMGVLEREAQEIPPTYERLMGNNERR
jgi:hypothetical protein